MLRTVLVEEILKKWKPLGNSIVWAVKASGQYCNMLSIYAEIVLECLIYLFNNQKYYLEQF